ncbi:MAG: hypothetical protein MK180_07655 [Rhodobacteraceae bacterium]|nr:hypothetical protein [Paracoccaceae bacterium]
MKSPAFTKAWTCLSSTDPGEERPPSVAGRSRSHTLKAIFRASRRNLSRLIKVHFGEPNDYAKALWGGPFGVLFTTSVSAQQFGVLDEVIFREPEHDGMSTWSVADPTRIKTQLTQNAQGPLTVDFDFEFSPNGNHLDLVIVLPTGTAGLWVHCSNYKRNYLDTTDISFGRCTLTDAWLQTINETKTLKFEFLGGGGINDGVKEPTWVIEPFDTASLPLKVETISLSTPVRKGDAAPWSLS